MTGAASLLWQSLSTEQLWAQWEALATCIVWSGDRETNPTLKLVIDVSFFHTKDFSNLFLRFTLCLGFRAAQNKINRRFSNTLGAKAVRFYSRGRRRCFSPVPAKTYAKCKQCASLPLSLVTRPHHCAAFIRVEMICANKDRRPSSTLVLLFISELQMNAASSPGPCRQCPSASNQCFIDSRHPAPNWER